MKNTLFLSIVILAVVTVSGCATPYDHSGEGASVGGVVGALAGGIIGHQSGDGVGGALLGGMLGAAGGAIIGSTMAKPAPEYVYAQPVAVQPPPMVMAPAPTGYFTVNVPNRHTSGYTAVTLYESGSGYIGPQGEYYAQFPSIEQLSLMYGV